MVRRIALMALLAACFYACGCVRSIHPVLNDQQVFTDDSLAGTWVTDDGRQRIDVQKPLADKTYAVLYTDGDQKTGSFQVRLGKVGKLTIAEVKPQDPLPQASDVYKAHLLPLYSLLIVSQTAPQLKVATLSQDWLKKYLQGHPNDLQVVDLDKDSLVVTSSTDDMQKFILQHWQDQGALEEPSILVRPGDATTRNGGKD